MSKKYTGSCYIAVVGSESENGKCRDTIEEIKRAKGDTPPLFIRATKGYEARQTHLNNWIDNTKHPFILFLDSDMTFPKDTLERLRSHALPYVSGFYMRRSLNPIAPVWFENSDAAKMPMKPFTFVVEQNTLYPIGASGWGCILMHRDVVLQTRKLLKGEPDIIEDDMDVAPYDLGKILQAMNEMEELAKGNWNISTIAPHIQTLKDEIRPLRMVKDIVGSDIRFPFYAKLAGFQLYGDSGVNCGHMANYPITAADYANQPAHVVRSISAGMHKSHVDEIERLKKARNA